MLKVKATCNDVCEAKTRSLNKQQLPSLCEKAFKAAMDAKCVQKGPSLLLERHDWLAERERWVRTETLASEYCN
jgi:hypothetical protein